MGLKLRSAELWFREGHLDIPLAQFLHNKVGKTNFDKCITFSYLVPHFRSHTAPALFSVLITNNKIVHQRA